MADLNKTLLAVLSIVALQACTTVSQSGREQAASKAQQSSSVSGSAAPIAYFQANTGGDSMLARRTHGGYVLELHVIDGEHTIKPLAQCDRIAGGSALGGGTERELDVALCEGDTAGQGEYWLISEPGEVSVRRGPIGSNQEVVLTHRLKDASARVVGKGQASN